MGADSELATNGRSKVIDGLLATLIILILLAVLIGFIFLANMAGTTGIVLYIVLALVITWYFLKKSLDEKLNAVPRAWYGIISGMTAWTVLELGEILNLAGIECKDGVHLIILAAIVTWLLWNILPLGAHFFIFIFFINWAGHIVIKVQEYLGEFWEIFNITLAIYSWAALPIAGLIIYWIFTRSETRIQRLYAAGWLYLFIFTFVHMIFFH